MSYLAFYYRKNKRNSVSNRIKLPASELHSSHLKYNFIIHNNNEKLCGNISFGSILIQKLVLLGKIYHSIFKQRDNESALFFSFNTFQFIGQKLNKFFILVSFFFSRLISSQLMTFLFINFCKLGRMEGSL